MSGWARSAAGQQRRPVPPRGRIVQPVLHRARHDLSGPLPRADVALEFPVGQGRGAARRAAPRRRGSRSCSSPATAAAGSIRATCSATTTRRRSKPKEHELVTWLNHNEIIGFNAASLAPVANYSAQGPRDGVHRARASPATGSTIEGPLHDDVAAASHQLLFGDLPLVGVQAAQSIPACAPPTRKTVRQIGAGKNRPDPRPGPLDRAQRAAAGGRRSPARGVSAEGVSPAGRRPRCARRTSRKVDERLKAGDCFETAMRWAYRAALCSPDFLYHVEPAGAARRLRARLPAVVFPLELDARRRGSRQLAERRQACASPTCCAAKSSGC